MSTREPSVFKPAVEPYREQPHLGSITCAGSYRRKREKNQCDSLRGLTRLNKVRNLVHARKRVSVRACVGGHALRCSEPAFV